MKDNDNRTKEDIVEEMTKVVEQMKIDDLEERPELIDEYFDKVDGFGTVKFYVVEVEGVAKTEGWEFIGKLERVNNCNIIRQAVDTEIPNEYFTCELGCDHCNSNRHRNSTYLVRNIETGEFKQVGSSCLREYTNGLSAELAAFFSSFIKDIDDDYSRCNASGMKHWYDMKLVLRYAYDYVKHLGYVKSDAEFGVSTKVQVINAYRYDDGDSFTDARSVIEYRNQFKFDIDSDDVLAFVDSCIAYFRGLSDTDVAYNTYLHNLRIYSKSEYILVTDIGFVVSMIPTYMKHLKIEQDRAERQKVIDGYKKEYIGNVGDKVSVEFISCTRVTSFETKFGYTIRYKFVTSSNQVVMWDTSKDIDMQHGRITGTVKKHDTFNGMYQTWLTRCKVESIADDTPHDTGTFNLDEVTAVFDE